MSFRTWCCALLLCLFGPVEQAPGQVPLPDGQTIESVNFDRHIAPLLSKLGCNAGACHGNSEGKGGLRLSLFGFNPLMDSRAFVDPEQGRIDVDSPEESILLQKPSAIAGHGGGQRFSPDSWEYDLFRVWIADGAKTSNSTNRSLTTLSIEPNWIVLREQPTRLQVWATFDNGEREDVTCFSSWRVTDESVCAIDEQYWVKRKAVGDTYLVATYAGQPASVRIVVPHAKVKRPNQSREEQSDNLIDRFILEKLQLLGMRPASICDDATFLRRLKLVTTSSLPNPTETQRFMGNMNEHKRAMEIEKQLADPVHADLWATRMCEILGSRDHGVDLQASEPQYEEEWHGWIRQRFENNTPFDVLTNDILTATTRDGVSAAEYVSQAVKNAQIASVEQLSHYDQRPTFDWFWKRPRVNEELELETLAERVSAAFLGVRLQCAKCHKHPFDRWTQDDYRSFANCFSQVRFGLSPELRVALADKLQQQRDRAQSGEPTVRVPALREVFVTNSAIGLRSASNQVTLPAIPLGSKQELNAGGDRRVEFANWLIDRENPFFARNIVNRIWAFYFGRGLVDPVDAFSAANPATHPELLDALAHEFILNGYDVRKLESLILNSDTWQRSAQVSESISNDDHNYACFSLRILDAAQISDSLACALGIARPSAASLPSFLARDESLQPYFKVYSRPERMLSCDCERIDGPSLRQAMLLLSDPSLERHIVGAANRLVAELPIPNDSSEMKSWKSKVVEQVFLRTLCREPSKKEYKIAVRAFNEQEEIQRMTADLLWSLINTREFSTLH
ncbi:MAG: DUF1553 domain-containing protein [Pirellulaceae bacterium]|nr:DUF1553 domain-containing protein [Pirellulaceae bacterium]